MQNWDKIAIAAGIGAFSPVLLKGILLKGPKLLGALENMGKGLTKPNLKNYIRSLVASAIMNMEIANFTKGSFKLIPIEAVRSVIKISEAVVKQMHTFNIVLAITNDGQTVAVFYKGEAILTGTLKEVSEAMENIFKRGRKAEEIAAHLDEILNVANFVKRYANLLKTMPNEAFFWSGRTDNIGGMDIAREIATSRKGVTLEAIIDIKKIPMPAWETNPEVWAAVSKKYAEQVSGHIRAVIGKSLRAGNIWENYELPALKKNKNVKSITTIDPKTAKEKLIYKNK